MRFQKAISGLNASPSQIKRKLKTLTIPNYNMDVDEMLVLASQKISPIIEMLVESRSSVEHFISVKEYKDIEEVATIIEIISKALENIGFETNINTVNLDMTKYRNSANSQGYIYVDTSLLLDILELYNVLEYIQEDLRIFYRSIGIHSFVQTESGLISLSSNSSRNSNKIVFKMKKQPLKGSSSFGLLQNEFIVMPSTSDIGPLQGSKSQILARSDMSGNTPSTRRAKSASSFESVEKVEVTDVYCARRILIKCIYDLQEVSDYLGIPRKDVATICSRVEVLDRGAPLLDGADRRSVASADRRDVGAADTGGSTSKKSLAKGSHYEVDETDGQRRCCCDDCFAHFKGSGADTKESDDDQVIICIKGCNENEGDVQIVIRQCPDCKKADGKSAPLAPEATDSVESRRTLTSTKKVSTSEKRIPEEDKRSSKSQTSGYSPSKKSVDIKSEKSSKETQAKALEKPEKDTKGVESKILHNKDSEGSIICSDEEEEEKRPIEKQSYIENQARVSCSRIKLFEKTKFCLLTDTGQELVISLTVTPKELIEGSEKLSIRDIFSENEIPRDLSGSQESAKDASDRVSDRKSRGSKKSATTQQSSAQEPQTYFVADQYIPLGRTKICSSLDFDVTTADSRIRDKGIQNKDNNIMVQLDEFGADNLLRACRPAKCCRKAILNEKMKKCLPYAPSLRSLPLDQDDVSVINQSLQMSLQKVKNSTNLNKDFYGKQNQMYFLNPIYPVMYFFVEEDLAKDNLNDICLRTLVKQKLNFYINIVKDIPHEHNSKYEILYFSVESKLGKNVTNQSVKTYSVGDENNKSNDEKVDVEIAEVISNPLRWLKQKYSKYDERSLLQSQGLIIRNDSLIMRNLRKKKVVPSEHVQTKVNHNKSYISKIPVYQGRKVLCVNPDTEEKIEPQVCDISSGSLPRSQDISEELPAGLQELYRKSPNNNIGVAHKVNNKLDVEISCYDLKAKQSEYCFVQANKRNSKHLYIFNNLALQTSTVFLDNKNCQTSKTLLAYILNPNVHTENFNFKKKRIFKKTYNCENVTGLPNTCDEIENFVVTFDSDHSFSSNFSERDFRLSNSGCPRRQLTERGQEDSLSQSLMKLKETLERYEGINNEIARKSLQQTNINPIEYFVYQVSAYNNDKLNKKPSVMQKIVSKTKGLFSSVEKDMPREYNNPRNCLNLPQPEREHFCFNCGGYFTRNVYMTSEMRFLCPCQEDNETNPRMFEPCCKENNIQKSASNLSKLASASASSLQSIKNCIKKSVSGVFNGDNKNNFLGPCRCGKKVAGEEHVDSICISRDTYVVICNKKDTSTSTTKDSATQKCECEKCANFADDGTCCCSHCLGCLDKSFNAKSQKSNMGVETDARNISTSHTITGNKTSDLLETRGNSQRDTEKDDTISIDTQPGSLADYDDTPDPATNEIQSLRWWQRLVKKLTESHR